MIAMTPKERIYAIRLMEHYEQSDYLYSIGVDMKLRRLKPENMNENTED